MRVKPSLTMFGIDLSKLDEEELIAHQKTRDNIFEDYKYYLNSFKEEFGLREDRFTVAAMLTQALYFNVDVEVDADVSGID